MCCGPYPARQVTLTKRAAQNLHPQPPAGDWEPQLPLDTSPSLPPTSQSPVRSTSPSNPPTFVATRHGLRAVEVSIDNKSTNRLLLRAKSAHRLGCLRTSRRPAGRLLRRGLIDGIDCSKKNTLPRPSLQSTPRTALRKDLCSSRTN